MQDGAPELVLVLKAWLFFAFAIANILGNSKLVAGKNQHAGRKLAADIPGNNVHIYFLCNLSLVHVKLMFIMHICLIAWGINSWRPLFSEKFAVI